jgi:hypothetical protein
MVFAVAKQHISVKLLTQNRMRSEPQKDESRYLLGESVTMEETENESFLEATPLTKSDRVNIVSSHSRCLEALYLSTPCPHTPTSMEVRTATESPKAPKFRWLREKSDLDVDLENQTVELPFFFTREFTDDAESFQDSEKTKLLLHSITRSSSDCSPRSSKPEEETMALIPETGSWFERHLAFDLDSVLSTDDVPEEEDWVIDDRDEDVSISMDFPPPGESVSSGDREAYSSRFYSFYENSFPLSFGTRNSNDQARRVSDNSGWILPNNQLSNTTSLYKYSNLRRQPSLQRRKRAFSRRYVSSSPFICNLATVSEHPTEEEEEQEEDEDKVVANGNEPPKKLASDDDDATTLLGSDCDDDDSDEIVIGRLYSC